MPFPWCHSPSPLVVQSIDPSIAMPYWEYTIDAEIYDDYNWVDSPVFGADWYGEASPNNDDHIITEGMWAGVALPSGEPYQEWDTASTGEEAHAPLLPLHSLSKPPITPSVKIFAPLHPLSLPPP